MITRERLQLLVQLLEQRGHGAAIAWSEALSAPATADAFALEVIHVILNAGMKASVAALIMARCMRALRDGTPVADVYGHPGKAAAVETVWRDREQLFAGFIAADDKLAFCKALPWLGPITQFHLAKNLGEDFIKPDVHLVRLARYHDVTPFELCDHLAAVSGYRVGTIDTILWRSCADGLIDSAAYATGGWDTGFRGIAAPDSIAEEEEPS